MILTSIFGLLCLTYCLAAPLTDKSVKFEGSIDPKVKTGVIRNYDYDRSQIKKNVNNWNPDDETNVWELSGLFEGDIVINDDDSKNIARNGLVNETMRWPYGIIPYKIGDDQFDEEGIEKIKNAMEAFHDKTCLKFRPYNKLDLNCIIFESKNAGCYSSVGRQNECQVINLQSPACVKHGTIVHEILHAVGFFHQQSTFDRDDFVNIHWDNIKPGKEHNFKKYDNRTVTDYDIGYDYDSVMHYSSKAFSKNGNKTITPIKENAKIGQRKGMSKKDILKLSIMYADECRAREEVEEMDFFPDIILN